jgi:hypothetical protein
MENEMLQLKSFALALLLALAFPLTAAAEHHEKGEVPVRAAAVQVEALVVAVDKEARELSLQLPHGAITTMIAGPEMTRFDEIAVGDTVVATYMQALAADVREPTQEELEEPWVELDATAIAEAGMDPGVAGLRVVRAVCSIEGMNRVTRTVMIEDPRGKYHVIGDVDISRLEGLTLGTKVIMVYSQAVALTLEKQ